MMMLMRVSGKDGYQHYHHGPCRAGCKHHCIEKEVLLRVLARVDEARVGDEAQSRYSEKDSSEWFAEVTNDLYVAACAKSRVWARMWTKRCSLHSVRLTLGLSQRWNCGRPKQSTSNRCALSTVN